MRTRLLRLACLSYPHGYRAERGGELIDTALEASQGSRIRATVEALSLLRGGLRRRRRLAASVDPRDTLASGAYLCAWALAIVNLTVAVYSLTVRVHVLDSPVRAVYVSPSYAPYVTDWWWLSFAAASAGLIVALAASRRWVAVSMAGASFALVAYDALLLANSDKYDGRGHFDLFTYAQTSSFPGGREWLAAASVLLTATLVSGVGEATSRLRQRKALAFAFPLVVVLVAAARETWGAFFYLRWGVLAIVLVALFVAALAPRLTVVAAGVSLAALPSALVYVTSDNLSPGRVGAGAVLAGLTLGLILPIALLSRDRRNGHASRI